MSRRTKALIGAAVFAAAMVPIVAVAGDRFNDVPNTNVFHDDIGWLADSGVTIGCNPPDNDEFCPSDEVKREQMAAFMRRFAKYLDAEDGTPGMADHATTADSATQADDADTLDGYDADQIRPILHADGDASPGGTSLVDSGRVEVNSIVIDAPADGFLVASGHVFVNNQSGAQRQYALNLLVDGADALPQDWAAVTSFETGTEQNRGNFGYTVTIPITAGSHTITQEVGPYSGVASFFYNQEALTLVYYPGDSGSLVLSSIDTSASNPQGQ